MEIYGRGAMLRDVLDTYKPPPKKNKRGPECNETKRNKQTKEEKERKSYAEFDA